ncbi:hypothetical protein NDS46_31670 (plasmid) [Paenibacillus thiaminolyticus]|uniref:hypothetical protein n=1 Tax=Paenibacillus thiaminolyticus TaxID=49283 RepID=UPI00232FA916|nr:hypothetical protein [Paenibacillus thiaminolyticus]WCF11518.1 hypothetical protein NDS46_31670 [Paenibacillus thiaminolyticus]
MKESELFEPIKGYLIDVVGCSKVYGEVGSCDVLGVSGYVNVIVELKTSLSFKVMKQQLIVNVADIISTWLSLRQKPFLVLQKIF